MDATRAQDERKVPAATARAGMSASDVKALYGAVKFRIYYVFDSAPASRAVFEPRGKGVFASVIFVGGGVGSNIWGGDLTLRHSGSAR